MCMMIKDKYIDQVRKENKAILISFLNDLRKEN